MRGKAQLLGVNAHIKYDEHICSQMYREEETDDRIKAGIAKRWLVYIMAEKRKVWSR